MIISVDGYDGTGKTTLAKKLSTNYEFSYLYKPIIYKTMEENNCSYTKAKEIVENIEKEIFKKPINASEVAKYYCDALLWLKKYEKDYNIILDRGLLTTYAVVGNPEVEKTFDYYVDKGVIFSGSIYLTALDEERVRRIYNNDPNDPDLKYPVKWRDNNLEEYSKKRNINMFKIKTDNLSIDEVFQNSTNFVEEIIHNQTNNSKVLYKYKK